jgi:NADH-quinone oxidoreductase subunit J
VPLDNLVFWVFAPISIASAIAMLTRRNAVHAALFLIVNLFTIAVMFLLLDAPFLFAVQIIVYAGAIMVLFLFVIMLLGVDRTEPRGDRLVGQRVAAVVLAVGFALEIGMAVRAGIGLGTRVPAGFAANDAGNVQALSRVLFTKYFFPFEATSVLLIVAAIAAMVLAGRKSRAVTQAEVAGLGDADDAGPRTGPAPEEALAP